MPAARRTVGSVMNKLIERTNSMIERLRILEQESSVTKTRLTSLEEESIAQRNQLTEALRGLEERVGKAEERAAALEAAVKEIVAQLKKTVSVSKIRELEEMLDIYNPLRSQFATREEVQRMIEERLKGRE